MISTSRLQGVGNELVKHYHGMVKPIDVSADDKRGEYKGRPRKSTLRDEQILVWTVQMLCREIEGCMTLHNIKQVAGMEESLSYSTVWCYLQKSGYEYWISAHKGVLSEKDLKERPKYAKVHFDKEFLWKDMFLPRRHRVCLQEKYLSYTIRSQKITWWKVSGCHYIALLLKKEGLVGALPSSLGKGI